MRPLPGPRGWALGATPPLAVPRVGDPRGGSCRRGGPVGGASPAPAALGAVPAPATDPEGANAVMALGRVLPLRTSDGRVVDVAVLGVRLRARQLRG